jgi:hypothetical protein
MQGYYINWTDAKKNIFPASKDSEGSIRIHSIAVQHINSNIYTINKRCQRSFIQLQKVKLPNKNSSKEKHCNVSFLANKKNIRVPDINNKAVHTNANDTIRNQNKVRSNLPMAKTSLVFSSISLAALIFKVLTILTLPLFGLALFLVLLGVGVFAILGLILGIIAVNMYEKDPSKYKGYNLAVLSIVFSCIVLLFALILLALL